MNALIAANEVAANSNAFWGTSFGSILKTLLAAIGILLAITIIFKASGKFMGAKPAEGLRIALAGIAACVFLFRPELLTTVIELFGTIIDNIFSSGTELVDNSTVGGNTDIGG